jgi:phenylalanyl-tRNA synthetase beta chain
VGGLADRHGDRPAPPPIELAMDWLSRKLGRCVAEDEVRAILESLGFTVALVVPGIFSVTPPSWRATKDVSIKDDLLEEVGRMLGYDSIVPQAPLVPATPPPQAPERVYYRRIRNLVAAQGFTEVYNYSFVNQELASAFAMPSEAHVQVLNPIASDQTMLRASLLPRIWSNILENSKHLSSFRLFEIAREIHKRDTGLPDEIPHLAAAIYAREGDGAAGLFELKRLAECIMPDATVQPAAARAFEHPERAAEVFWRGENVGRLFELYPTLVPEGRAAILDIDLAMTLRLDTVQRRYQPLRRFPTSSFDLSVLAPVREPVGRIESRLAAAAGPELLGISFVREYIGAPLPPERKSVSYRMTVGAPDRTLSSDDVGAIRARIIEAMQTAGYELRI